MTTVNILIDGKTVSVPSNYTVMQAAESIGVEIPALCYDKDLEIVGACRMCLVDIEGKRKLETACSTKVRNNMVVKTKTDEIVEIRKEILQLLLDSHPNDCLTCSKAGECLLQKYAYEYGVKFREHKGAKRKEELDLSSPYIIKDDSKCILCGKCVRTCGEVKVEREVLQFANRGYETKIVLDADDTLETSKCVSCNRCVTVCPVGALVDRRAVDKGRIWDAKKTEVKCNICSYGCKFEVLSKRGKNIAVRALPPSEGRPLCLKGRLATELKYLDNPETPYRKIDREFVESTFAKTLGLEEILEKIEKVDK